MDQPTVTLIGSIGSTLVGVVAVVSSVWQNSRTLRHQRHMASDERLAERRAELYVELIDLTKLLPDELGRLDPDVGKLRERLRELDGRVHAFASDAVTETFDELHADCEAPNPPGPRGLSARGEKLWEGIYTLRSQARSELQPDTRSARLRRLTFRRRRALER